MLGGGCSGFKYNFSFEEKVQDNDNLFDKTVIDSNSLKIIEGSIVDFKKELIGNSFTITNPKANSSCGCGLVFFCLMKITSWNVNSVRARILNIKDYLKQSNPDILMIQEIKTEEKNFPLLMTLIA